MQGREIGGRSDAGLHGDGADAILARREDIGGSVADERDGSLGADPGAGPGLADGEPRQAAAGARPFAECAEEEVVAQPGALELVPADAREVTGYESEQNSPPGEAFEHDLHGGAVAVSDVGADAQIIPFGGALNVGQPRADGGAGSAGIAQHDRK